MENSETKRLRPFREMEEAGLSFTLCACLPTLLSVVVGLIIGQGGAGGDLVKYLSFLLPQICFAFAAILFFRRSKTSPKACYAPCKWYYFPLALVMQFGLLFCLGELNEYFVDFLGLFGYQASMTEDILPSLGGWNFLPALLVIAVLPAVFEEAVFRGILSGSMQRGGWGTAATVFLSGALFSLFHHNPEQTVYQFLCGVCYALLYVRSGSVFPTMLAHLSNNAVILAMQAFGGLNAAGEIALSQGGYIALVVCAAVALAGSVLPLALIGRKRDEGRGMPGGKRLFLFAAVGIAVCAVEWVVVLVEGFLP